MPGRRSGPPGGPSCRRRRGCPAPSFAGGRRTSSVSGRSPARARSCGLEPATGPDPARRAGTAALARRETPDVLEELGAGDIIVDGDDAAVSEVGTDLAQRLEGERRVELRRERRSRRAGRRPGRRVGRLLREGRRRARRRRSEEKPPARPRRRPGCGSARSGRRPSFRGCPRLRAGRRRDRHGRRSMGTEQIVSTLLTTVGRLRKPRSVGNGGRVETSPRSPSIEWISEVSSPATYEPAPSKTSISKSRPLPWTSSPRCPASRASAIARPQGVAGARVLRAHVDEAVGRAGGKGGERDPSSTRCGSRSIKRRSTKAPGSPSSPLQIR